MLLEMGGGGLIVGAFAGGFSVERVGFDFCQGDAAVEIEGEHALDQVTQAGRATGTGGEEELPFAGGGDGIEDLLRGVTAKGEETGGHEEEADAQGPDVDLGALVRDAQPEFRGGVVQGAQIVSEAGQARAVLAGKAKIAEEDAAVLVEDVLQLEVLVDVAQLVHLLDGSDHLLEEAQRRAHGEGDAHAGFEQLVQHGAWQLGHDQLDLCFAGAAF